MKEGCLRRAMDPDPERQALLSARARRRRTLTYEEVLEAHRHPSWRKVRCLLVVLFWCITAMFLAMVACILMAVKSCGENQMPSVPPVHLTFTPLIRQIR